MPVAAGAAEPSGLVLLVLSESFAVRALLGSLSAAALVLLATRLRLVRGRNARRLLVLAPVLTAAATAAGSAAWLPELWLTTRGADEGSYRLVEVVGFLRLFRPMDLLVAAYSACVIVLLTRRTFGALALRGLLRDARVPAADGRLLMTALAGAERMRMRPVRVVELRDCPGGAFATGVVRPLIAVDPALVDAMDDRELEGLLAHELAHVRRRDPLLWVLVGAFRDAAFFVGPLRLATRWLHREQEESADEAAAAATRRPAALASSILKAWERRAASPAPQLTCAAVPPARPRLLGRRAGRAAGEAVTQRVERLITGAQALPPWRVGAEALLALTVIAAATTAAVTLPGLVGDSLVLNYSRAEHTPALLESPAFATFHQLTEGQAAGTKPEAGGDGVSIATCPCLETQAQLRAGVTATAPPADPRLVWTSDGDAMSMRRFEDANALWLLRGDGTGIWLQRGQERRLTLLP